MDGVRRTGVGRCKQEGIIKYTGRILGVHIRDGEIQCILDLN